MTAFSCFFLYADTPRRRAALTASSPVPDEYLLYGLPDLANRGFAVRHNLERKKYGRLTAKINKIINLLWHSFGGYGGDWVTVIRSLPAINQSSMVFSTADRVGIPLVILKHWGFVKPPILYASIGLPERLAQLKRSFMPKLYFDAFKQVGKLICYGYEEATQLREWFEADAEYARFVPFGVNTDLIRPRQSDVTVDVLSIGADPQRDFSLLLTFARRQPLTAVRIITNKTHARQLTNIPTNVQIITDISLDEVLAHIASARVVVLPVKENSYSGATTVLLQAMAMAKPVVVSAVGAIRQGYSLEDGVNCRFVKPGSTDELEQAVTALLHDSMQMEILANAARKTAVTHHAWNRYVETLIYNLESI